MQTPQVFCCLQDIFQLQVSICLYLLSPHSITLVNKHVDYLARNETAESKVDVFGICHAQQ